MSDERKAPEYPTEYPPEDTGTRWIPIAEVEALIGKRERNARYWLERHDIPARGERPKLFDEAAISAKLAELGQGHRKAPEIPPEYPPESTGMPPENPRWSVEPIEAAYQVAGEMPPGVALVPLQTMVEELRGLATELAELARRNEGLALEVGSLRAQVAGHQAQLVAKDEALAARDLALGAKDETIAELRHRADVAEAEVLAIRAQPSPPPAVPSEAIATEGPREIPDPSGGARGGLWARLRRWWPE